MMVTASSYSLRQSGAEGRMGRLCCGGNMLSTNQTDEESLKGSQRVRAPLEERDFVLPKELIR